jgi:hypothetical protein
MEPNCVDECLPLRQRQGLLADMMEQDIQSLRQGAIRPKSP